MQERPIECEVMEAKVGIPADIDHIIYASDNNKNETINKLKNMIILHLEVIKGQADKLLQKDKFITKLKQENEDLRQKLEAATTARGRGRTPRKNPVGIRSPAKQTDDITTTKKSAPNKRRKKEDDACEVKPKHAKIVAEQQQQTDGSGGEDVDKQMSVITSDKPYLSCEWKKSFAEIDAEREPHLRATLEIPSWIDRDMSPLYLVDGTENMSDEAFMKRHQKHETHEKRRKRWDVQRLREVRTVEKLRQRYMKEELHEEKLKIKPLMTSFYPPVDALQYIHIVERLPVLAFGEPIPEFEALDFYLPWQKSPDTTMSPSTSFTKTRFFKKSN